MTRPAFPLEAEQRELIVAHIAQHLRRLDDRALLRLVNTLQEPDDSPETVADTLEQAVSRRSFIATLLGGGVLAATTSALAVWQWGLMHRQDLTEELQTLKRQLEITSEELTRQLEASNRQLEHAWGLLELYTPCRTHRLGWGGGGRSRTHVGTGRGSFGARWRA